jgi:uncharacterized protein (TIGR02231 family)
MKKRLLVVAVFCAFSGTAAAQEAARISRVILYPGGATIERSVKVSPGGGRVEMTGLPANFDPRTLRVETGPGVRVGEVVVKDASRAEPLGGRESLLEAKIEALKDEKGALDVQVKTAELQRDYLNSMTIKPLSEGGGQTVSVDGKTIPVVLAAIHKGANDAYGVMQRIEIRKRAIDKQIEVLARDLARLRSGARDVRTVSIAYSASKAGELRAVYQVANAGWKPAYRASLDSASSRVELERLATVQQRTGEDWRGVTLRLSTGQPRSGQVVDPGTWQVMIQSQVALSNANGLVAVDAAAPYRALGERERKDEAAAPIVAQFHTEYATEFEVPGKVDLAADGRQVGVSLTSDSVAAKQRIRIVPRGDTAAMVTAEGELPEGVWIPGDVQLYRDGSYIGSTFWQAQAKEKLVLPFGRDDRVQVAVKRVKNRTGSSGFVGQRNERQIADLYTVTSRHKVPVELLLLEASPVAVSDQVKVEAVFEPKPKTVNWEDRRGVVAWEQPLAPGQTLKFVTDYTISYPKDAAIAGLP